VLQGKGDNVKGYLRVNEPAPRKETFSLFHC
jgi:hypothetical protein